MTTLRDDIERSINANNAENGSNTPDFILALYLMDCLAAFDRAVQARAGWYGRMDLPGQSAPAPSVEEPRCRCHRKDDHRAGCLAPSVEEGPRPIRWCGNCGANEEHPIHRQPDDPRLPYHPFWPAGSPAPAPRGTREVPGVRQVRRDRQEGVSGHRCRVPPLRRHRDEGGRQAMSDENMEVARQLAAQAWCEPETEMIEMDVRLAEAFAKRIATLRESLAKAREEVAEARRAWSVEYQSGAIWQQRALAAEAALATERARALELKVCPGSGYPQVRYGGPGSECGICHQEVLAPGGLCVTHASPPPAPAPQGEVPPSCLREAASVLRRAHPDTAEMLDDVIRRWSPLYAAAAPQGEDEVTARTDCGCGRRHVCGRAPRAEEGDKP